MGLFKSIKNVFKKVVGGVKKVFKKVAKEVGRFLSSDFGKIVMIGLTVVTLGAALVAGIKAGFASTMAGKGFAARFVEGGKAFFQTLTGMGGKKAAATGSETAVAGAPTATTGKEVVSAATDAVSPVVESAGQSAAVPGMANPANPFAQAPVADFAAQSSAGLAGAPMGTLPSGNVVTGTPGLLENAGQVTNLLAEPAKQSNFFGMLGEAAANAGKWAWDAAKGFGSYVGKNPSMAVLAGNALSGWAQGEAQRDMFEQEQEEQRRFDQLWADFDMDSVTSLNASTNARPINTSVFDRVNLTSGSALSTAGG